MVKKEFKIHAWNNLFPYFVGFLNNDIVFFW